MEESRTKNSVNNFKFGALTQVLNTLINFAVRTVFIKMLGAEYLGVNGLFSNILTVLAFNGNIISRNGNTHCFRISCVIFLSYLRGIFDFHLGNIATL